MKLVTDLDFQLYELEKAACQYEGHAQSLRMVIARYKTHGLPYDNRTQNHEPNL